MISVFLSHSSQDKPFVRELADALEKDGEIRVWLDERELGYGENIVEGIADGLDSDFILLILSPDSVESNWVKEEWTDAFWDQTDQRQTKLLGVLYRDCTIPRLLRNKKYFDLRTNQPEGFREIRGFLVTQRPAPSARVNYLPVRPPVFVGREEQLTAMRLTGTNGVTDCTPWFVRRRTAGHWRSDTPRRLGAVSKSGRRTGVGAKRIWPIFAWPSIGY